MKDFAPRPSHDLVIGGAHLRGGFGKSHPANAGAQARNRQGKAQAAKQYDIAAGWEKNHRKIRSPMGMLIYVICEGVRLLARTSQILDAGIGHVNALAWHTGSAVEGLCRQLNVAPLVPDGFVPPVCNANGVVVT